MLDSRPSAPPLRPLLSTVLPPGSSDQSRPCSCPLSLEHLCSWRIRFQLSRRTPTDGSILTATWQLRISLNVRWSLVVSSALMKSTSSRSCGLTCLSVGYRLSGTFADAEDAVQDAWLRWYGLGVERDRIADLRAWLTTVVSRMCLDRLRSAAHRRETYVGRVAARTRRHRVGDRVLDPTRWPPSSPTKTPGSPRWWCWNGCRPISGWPSCCTTASGCRLRRDGRRAGHQRRLGAPTGVTGPSCGGGCACAAA